MIKEEILSVLLIFSDSLKIRENTGIEFLGKIKEFLSFLNRILIMYKFLYFYIFIYFAYLYNISYQYFCIFYNSIYYNIILIYKRNSKSFDYWLIYHRLIKFYEYIVFSSYWYYTKTKTDTSFKHFLIKSQ